MIVRMRESRLSPGSSKARSSRCGPSFLPRLAAGLGPSCRERRANRRAIGHRSPRPERTRSGRVPPELRRPGFSRTIRDPDARRSPWNRPRASTGGVSFMRELPRSTHGRGCRSSVAGIQRRSRCFAWLRGRSRLHQGGSRARCWMVRVFREIACSLHTSRHRRAPCGVVRGSSSGLTGWPTPVPYPGPRVLSDARIADFKGDTLSTQDGSCRQGSRSSVPVHWRRPRVRGTFSRALQPCAWPGPVSGAPGRAQTILLASLHLPLRRPKR